VKGKEPTAGKDATDAVGKEPRFLDPKAPLEDRVRDLVSRLTLDEKVRMMASRQPAVARLGIPEFQLGGEAAHGLVARDGFTTVFPQTQGLAATWDPELLERVGAAVSDEARAYYRKRQGLGGLCLFAPTVDLERDPRWGRTEEGYGEDPVLVARLAGAYVRGLQGTDPYYLKTVPTPKHFYANNNEKDRASASASIGSRLRRNYYLVPFEAMVREYGVHSIMTSYNRINGIPAMLNPEILSVVKGEWELDGFVVCDGGALHQLVETHHYFEDYAEAFAESLRRGTDNISEDTLKVTPIVREAVSRGLLQEEDLDRALLNVFRIRFRLGQFDPPEHDPYADVDSSVICSPQHTALARETAAKSVVLLRNDAVEGDPLLPLDRDAVKSVAVIGPTSDVMFRDWYAGTPSYRVSPLAAIVEVLGSDRVIHADGSDIVSLRHKSGEHFGIMGWHDGTLSLNRHAGETGELFRRTDFGWGNQVFRSLANGRYLRLENDGHVSAGAEEVFDWYVTTRFDFRPHAAAADGSDASTPDAHGSAGADESAQAWDVYAWNGGALGLDDETRLSVVADDQVEPVHLDVVKRGVDEAVQAAEGADLAVVFLGTNPVLVAKEEIDRPNIELPPEQARLLEAVAAANPRTIGIIISGYPHSFGDVASAVPAWLYMAHGGPEGGRALCDCLFGDSSPAGRLSMTWYQSSENLPDIMDYDIVGKPRTYLYTDREIQFPFGYGLSYGAFHYEAMEATWEGDDLAVRVRITNDGGRASDEVVQVYGSCVDSGFVRPRRQLLDFRRVAFEADEAKEIDFRIPKSAFRLWEPAMGGWIVEESTWTIAAGPNSQDLPIQQTIQLAGKRALPIDASSPLFAEHCVELHGAEFWEFGRGGTGVRPKNPDEAGFVRLGRVRLHAGEGLGVGVTLAAAGACIVELHIREVEPGDAPRARALTQEEPQPAEAWGVLHVDESGPADTAAVPRELRIEGSLDPGTYDLALRLKGEVVVGALRFLETCSVQPSFVTVRS
jgi:beta-glucosidase